MSGITIQRGSGGGSGGGMAIGGAVTGATAGRVLLAGAGPVLADNADLTFAGNILDVKARLRINGQGGIAQPSILSTMDGSGTCSITFETNRISMSRSGEGQSIWIGMGPASYFGLSYGGTDPDVALVRVGAAVAKLTDGATGGGILEFPQVSAGGTPSTNSARFYCKDGGGTAELYGMDEAGNETLQTPHSKDAPASLYDADDPNPHLVVEVQHYLGYVRYTNHTRAARLAGLSDAEKAALPAEARACVHRETFDETNKRLGTALAAKSWAAEQDKLQAAYDELRDAEQARHDAWAAALEVHEAAKAAAAEIATRPVLAEPVAGIADASGADAAAPADLPPDPGPEPAVRPTLDVRKPVPAWLAALGVK